MLTDSVNMEHMKNANITKVKNQNQKYILVYLQVKSRFFVSTFKRKDSDHVAIKEKEKKTLERL